MFEITPGTALLRLSSVSLHQHYRALGAEGSSSSPEKHMIVQRQESHTRAESNLKKMDFQSSTCQVVCSDLAMAAKAQETQNTLSKGPLGTL